MKPVAASDISLSTITSCPGRVKRQWGGPPGPQADALAGLLFLCRGTTTATTRASCESPFPWWSIC